MKNKNFFFKFFLTATITVLALTAVFNVVQADSGAIWTTSDSCGTPQNVNQYPAGSHLYINGSGFDPNASYSYTVTTPGANGTDVLPPGNVVTDGDGNFCIDAGVVPSGGPYQVKVGTKGDNFSVDDPVEVSGCTDPTANNYDPLATVNDGSCTYDPPPPDPVLGCTDPTATNYNPLATQNDGSCQYPPPPVSGCTDPTANNYDPLATVNDGSCTYDPPPPDPVLGCTDPTATNYNPLATQNDGSCTYDGTPPVDRDGSKSPSEWEEWRRGVCKVNCKPVRNETFASGLVNNYQGNAIGCHLDYECPYYNTTVIDSGRLEYLGIDFADMPGVEFRQVTNQFGTYLIYNYGNMYMNWGLTRVDGDNVTYVMSDNPEETNWNIVCSLYPQPWNFNQDGTLNITLSMNSWTIAMWLVDMGFFARDDFLSAYQYTNEQWQFGVVNYPFELPK